MSTVGILLAAGGGSRLGLFRPKALISLGGKPVARYSLESMASARRVDGVVLVLPEAERDAARELMDGLEGVLGLSAVVSGGSSRQESVRRGLKAMGTGVDVVVCHDAARPFATPLLFERVLRALDGAEGAEGVVPVLPVTDTVKRVTGRRIVETVPRHELGLAQTPQAFTARALLDAHSLAWERGYETTDDAALLEAAGLPVVAVEGEPGNFKVTSPEDLRRAEEMVRTEVRT